MVKDGGVFFMKGYGYSDLEDEIPADPQTTVFRIGSTSKLFTATAVMQLVEEGKIDLDANINRYLERFQIPDAYPQPVTTAHLLTHTGGFDERVIGSFARTPSEVRPLGEYLAEHMPARVMPPGQVTSYSNHGLALAGYIVETISCLPFEEYVAEEILEPLGMAHSSFAQPLPPALAADMAIPYPQGVEPGPMLYTLIAPAGMLSTTTDDMARFLIAHLQDGRYGDTRILEEEAAQLMHRRHFANQPDIPGWAYGFTERTENGQRVLDHGGADPTGYGSMAVLLPEQNLGFFAVINSRFRDELLMELSKALLDHYYPHENLPPENRTDCLTLGSRSSA
jgi:CubicO group peptidase (beta-lactamase class C family)